MEIAVLVIVMQMLMEMVMVQPEAPKHAGLRLVRELTAMMVVLIVILAPQHMI
jgi:hypothetical protein